MASLSCSMNALHIVLGRNGNMTNLKYGLKRLPFRILTYNVLDLSLPACVPSCLRASLPACLPACVPACVPACLPACLPACVPVSTNLKYYCHCGAGAKIG
jgi:hypothetical protein